MLAVLQFSCILSNEDRFCYKYATLFVLLFVLMHLIFLQCTKLRQKVFGDNHPLVQQSLDFFATVYAEVGKVKYTGIYITLVN